MAKKFVLILGLLFLFVISGAYLFITSGEQSEGHDTGIWLKVVGNV